MRLVKWTSRRIDIGLENLDEAKALSGRNSYIMATWHQNLVGALMCTEKPAVGMASKSKDGQIAASVSEALGIMQMRGSSSKGGQAALNDMKTLVDKHNIPAGLTIDGPRGPAHHPKKGVFILSHECKISILPFMVVSSKTKVFPKSWDKFRLPLPFGKIYVSYGKPFIAEYLDEDDLKNYTALLTEEQDRMEANISKFLSF